MRKTAIKVEGLGKQYRIGSQQESYKTLRDQISGALRAPLRIFSSTGKKQSKPATDTFWALRDVSFEIPRGEAVGVIGRNGAGKSTLLKVLSRITEPTTGYADIHGRVRSLLEVGTGFHQELTGRENIFLNGAILGMHRDEIMRKFDEIVAFAEVEKFINTPVKRYSSGMYLRLAFAVAANLESEILFVDEVLAVGDAAFQKKCLGKMSEVAKEGRTVMFVSHNMSAVKELCQSGILLDGGQVAFQGSSADCIGRYLKLIEEKPIAVEAGTKPFAVGQVQIHSRAGNAIVSGEPFRVTLPLAGQRIRNPWMFFIIEDFTGITVVHSRVTSGEIGAETIDGVGRLELELPGLWLAPGIYTAYFKFIVPDANSSSGRFMSERAIVEVHGEFKHHGKAVLSPEVKWELRPEDSTRDTAAQTSKS
jgi:lipopolysaccharide transport system ATP-binding protein